MSEHDHMTMKQPAAQPRTLNPQCNVLIYYTTLYCTYCLLPLSTYLDLTGKATTTAAATQTLLTENTNSPLSVPS